MSLRTYEETASTHTHTPTQETPATQGYRESPPSYFLTLPNVLIKPYAHIFVLEECISHYCNINKHSEI